MARSKLYMEIIEEDKLVDNAKEVGDYFLEKLKELELNNARGKGLLLAFDLENTEARDAMFNNLSENILCLKCGPKSIRFRPHLTFSKEDVDKAVSFIKAHLC
jgi:L-lysine 6-transaminase